MHALVEDISTIADRRFGGRVSAVKGLMVEVQGPPPGLALGARACVQTAHAERLCEVVGFHDDRAVLMPFDAVEGVRPGDRVRLDPTPLSVRPSDAWLGRVVDSFGHPVDGGPPVLDGPRRTPVRAAPPPAQSRDRVGDRLNLGVRALNAFVPACRGQRLGLFAGSGVGKSVLMGMLAKNAAADVIVIGLIGERGREVREFVEDALGPEGRARSIVVAATSDEPALRRRQACYLSFAIAEHFRDEGRHVLLLVDSITRFALAQREIGLAAGEPPTTKGYTPSVFAELPKLLERAGPGAERADGAPAGAVTGLFTVLVDGGDMEEPVADAVRGILDGHVVMERAIAERGRYPAINVLKSVSRMMPGCCSADEWALVRRARGLLAAYADMEELIRIGAYSRGADPQVDAAVLAHPALEAFLSQNKDDATDISESFARLEEALKNVPSE